MADRVAMCQFFYMEENLQSKFYPNRVNFGTSIEEIKKKNNFVEQILTTLLSKLVGS